MTAFNEDETPLYRQVAGERLFSPDSHRPHTPAPYVEDWSVGGDLDRTVPDPSPVEVTDPTHPDYVAPWWPL